MKYTIEYLKAKTGIDTINVNGYFLHSKYDPVKEAKRIIEKEYKEHFVHILFGYGNGYLVEEFNMIKKNNEELLIIDPLKHKLDIKNEEVYEFEDINDFKNKLISSLEYLNTEVKIICNPNYDKLFLEEYKLLLQTVKDTQWKNKVQVNTIEYASDKWQKNLLHNMVYLVEDGVISEFYRKVNQPIVIVSGGPSLTKQVKNLKKYREHIFLMAAGSAINSLLKLEIIPDVVVSIDGGKANYKHFKDININIPLFYSLNSHYKIRENWTGTGYVFSGFEDEELQLKIKNKYNVSLPLIKGGGSVANYCYSIATMLTNKPIALIGQDLAYTNLKTHADGNLLAKKVNMDYLTSRQAFLIKDCYGEDVYTDYAFLSMRDSFEELAINYPHCEGLYNCTEGGLEINGFQNEEFYVFLHKYAKKTRELVNVTRHSMNITWEIFRSDFEKDIIRCKSLKKDCLNLILSMKKDYYGRYFSKKTLKLLKLTDENIRNTIEKEIMLSGILDPLVRQVMLYYKEKSDETKDEKFIRVYKQNTHWYEGIIVAMTKMELYLNSAIKLGDELYWKS